MSNDNMFLKPERPFLLIYESEQDGVSYSWLEDEDELKDVIKEVKSYGCTIVDAIEIGSYREINTDEI
jgi:DNA-binding HxlR family transcriptional regulator